MNRIIKSNKKPQIDLANYFNQEQLIFIQTVLEKSCIGSECISRGKIYEELKAELNLLDIEKYQFEKALTLAIKSQKIIGFGIRRGAFGGVYKTNKEINMNDTCTCGGKFIDAEDFRDHMPCSGSQVEHLRLELETATIKLKQAQLLLETREAKKLSSKEAQVAYKAVWTQYCLATDLEDKLALEKVMDSLQPDIAFGPADLVWQEFIKTLPGFTEFWNGWYDKVISDFEKTQIK